MIYEVNLFIDPFELHACYVKTADLNKAKYVYKYVLSTLYDYEIKNIDDSDFFCLLEISYYDNIKGEIIEIQQSPPILFTREILDSLDWLRNLW